MAEKRRAKKEVRIRLDDDLIEKVSQIARKNGLPVAAQVRMYILRGLEREGFISKEVVESDQGGQQVASEQ
jgi:predicted transcriptional regulator